MSNYAYVAVDPSGSEMSGVLDVADQSEALKRIKEMGLFPTRVLEKGAERPRRSLRAGDATPGSRRRVLSLDRLNFSLFPQRVKPATLSTFTRQLATLVEAGLPLLRGLKILEEQEENRRLKSIIGNIAEAIENGSSCAEAVSMHPKIFNPLYVNMVRAGEISGALDVTLERLAGFQEKAQKIKGKIKAAMFYPCAVITIAIGILAVLMIYVVPRFKAVFEGLMNGKPLPAFSTFIFGLSEAIKNHTLIALGFGVAAVALGFAALQTKFGRLAFDYLKLKMPVLGQLFRKAAISRFARTLGTLIGNGVPILQALQIVRETAGNVVVASVISRLHENVKQGDPLAPTLKTSGVFPLMVAGMVDVGEQTGALPEMLAKIADNYDNEVDNAASALTSILEPLMIVFLAVIVGSIVIAMFLPILSIINDGFDPSTRADM
jgi:type IV pilus assembly protein PilC